MDKKDKAREVDKTAKAAEKPMAGAPRQDGMRFRLADPKAEGIAYEMKSGGDTVRSTMPAPVALEIANRIGKASKDGKRIECGDRTFDASDFEAL